MCILKRCKDSANRTQWSLLQIAEAKPVLAGDFLKSPAKVQLFAHTAKQNAQKQPFCAHFFLFVQHFTAHPPKNQVNSRG